MRNLLRITLYIHAIFVVFIMNLSIPVNAQNKIEKDLIKIAGVYPGFEGDQLKIIYWDSLPYKSSSYNLYKIDTVTLDGTGKFCFNIKESHSIHFILEHIRKKDNSVNRILEQYIAEPGDNVKMMVVQDKTPPSNLGGLYFDISRTIDFSGKGAEKYQLLYELKTKWQNAAVEHFQKENFLLEQQTKSEQSDDPIVLDMERRWDFFIVWKTIADVVLDKYKQMICPETFGTLKADVYGEMMFYRLLRPLYISLILERKKNGIKSSSDALKNWYYKHILLKMPVISEKDLVASSHYSNFLIYKAMIEADFIKSNGTKTVFDILFNYPPISRERLLTEYLVYFDDTFKDRNDWSNKCNDALKVIKNPIYSDLINETLLNKRSGTVVYDFELPDKNNKLIRLSDFKGKVVVLDFWYTGCAGCKQFFQNHLSKAEKYFEHNDKVVFIAVSIDAFRDKWLKSLNDGQYTSPDVVNLYTAGQGTKHPVIAKLGIRSYPTPFIIDQKGRMLNTQKSALTRAKDNKLIETIKQVLRDH